MARSKERETFGFPPPPPILLTFILRQRFSCLIKFSFLVCPRIFRGMCQECQSKEEEKSLHGEFWLRSLTRDEESGEWVKIWASEYLHIYGFLWPTAKSFSRRRNWDPAGAWKISCKLNGLSLVSKQCKQRWHSTCWLKLSWDNRILLPERTTICCESIPQWGGRGRRVKRGKAKCAKIFLWGVGANKDVKVTGS